MAGNDEALVRAWMPAIRALRPPTDIRRAERVDQAITDDGQVRLDRAYGALQSRNAAVTSAVSVAVPDPDDISAVVNLADRLTDHAAAIAELQPLTGSAAVDGRTALLAAIAAVEAAGGGTVLVKGDYGFTGVIDVPTAVNLIGDGGGKADTGTRFVGLDAAAQLRFGDTTTGQYGGRSGNFAIDGNGVATDPLFIGICNGRHFDSIFVFGADAGGAAMTVALSQNSLYSNINIETCDGDGLVFDSGCANNDFQGLRIADVEGHAIRFVSTVSPPSGFVDYPTYNRVRGFMVEHFSGGGAGLVYHGVGSENRFSDGVFSLAAVSSAKTLVELALDDVGKPSSHLQFENVSWIGVQAHVTAIAAGAGNSYLLTGVHTFGAILRANYLAAGAAVHNAADVTLNAVTDWFVANGGGITEDAAIRTYTRSPLEIDRPVSGNTAIQVKNGGSSRFVVDNNGVMTWPNSSVTLYPDSANLLRTDDGLLVHVDAVAGLLVEKASGLDVFLVNTNGATGAVALPNGSLLLLYSDNYSTVKGSWDAATGNLSTEGALNVEGAATIDDALTVTGNADIQGTLNAEGAATFDGPVTITATAAGAFLVESDAGADIFIVNTAGLVGLVNGSALILYADGAYADIKGAWFGNTGTLEIRDGGLLKLYSDDAATIQAQISGAAGYIDLKENAAPGTPASGYSRLYVKSDGSYYQKDDAGTETSLAAGGGGGTIAVQEEDVDVDAAADTLDFDGSDFNLTGEAGNEVRIALNYGTGAGQPAEGNHSHSIALDNLSDVVVSSPALNQGVFHDGTDWDNRYPPIYATLGPFHLNDVPGTATTEMALLYFTAATAVAQGTLGASSENDLRMPGAGRVVAAFLNTDTARTAGTATLQIRINNAATAFESGAVALDATNTIRDSVRANPGLAFASGDAVGVAIVTSGWTPTTADLTAFIVVRFDLF